MQFFLNFSHIISHSNDLLLHGPLIGIWYGIQFSFELLFNLQQERRLVSDVTIDDFYAFWLRWKWSLRWLACLRISSCVCRRWLGQELLCLIELVCIALILLLRLVRLPNFRLGRIFRWWSSLFLRLLEFFCKLNSISRLTHRVSGSSCLNPQIYSRAHIIYEMARYALIRSYMLQPKIASVHFCSLGSWSTICFSLHPHCWGAIIWFASQLDSSFPCLDSCIWIVDVVYAASFFNAFLPAS